MAIEKFEGTFAKEDGGCTIVINQTIQSIRDPYILGLYVYLLTKPPSWNLHYKEIMRHFDCSKDMAYKMLNGLMELKLLTRERVRDVGKFVKFTYTLFLRPRASTGDSPFPCLPEPVRTETYKTNILPLENIDNTISVSDETNNGKFISDKQLVDAYHETLPDSPQIRAIDTKLSNQFRKMQRNWPKYSSTQAKFTLEGFIGFLEALKTKQPGFLRKYTTAEGNTRQNNLRTITSETNLAKLINGEFNFK
jgi:hypothetical protein